MKATMRVLWVLMVVLALTGPAWAQAPRPCDQDRDQLRVALRLLADGRGTAEWALADALARVQRLEQELAALKPAPKAPEVKP